MDRRKPKRTNEVDRLLNEYESMSKTGTIGFFDKLSFQQILDYLEEEQQIDKALEIVEHALEQHGYSEDFYLRKAQLLLLTNAPSSALDCCKKAAIYAPNDMNVLLVSAETHTKLEEYGEAESCLELARQYAQSRQELADVHLMEAFLCENKDDFKRMYRSLRRALILDPNNTLALERIWVSVEMCQNYNASILLHKDILTHNPYNSMAWYNLGHAHANLEQYQSAADAFEFAIVADENCEFAYRDAMHAYMELGDFKRSLELGLELVVMTQPETDLFVSIGDCYFEMEDLVHAIRYYRGAIELNDQNDRAFFRLGSCYDTMGDWDKSIAAYSRALDLDDRKEEYYAVLGEAYYRNHDDRKAAYFLEKITEIAPSEPGYWVQYVAFLIETEDADMALGALAKASVYCNCPELLYCKVAALFMKKHNTEAYLLLAEALSQDVDGYKWLFEIYPESSEDGKVWQTIAEYADISLDYL